tara:strand:- start:23993 stop:25078 length:1086 start_codon:yes stop_codon:yes gene_type:complete
MPAISAQVAAETAWPVIHISVSFTLAFLVWASFAPVVGMCIDRGWGAVVMVVGGITGTLTLFFLSTVTDRWVFSGALLVLGMCMAATLYDPCFALMMRRLGTRGVDATATVTLIAGLATLLTFPLVMALSGVMEWREIILVFAVLAIFAVLLLPKQDRNAVRFETGCVPSRFKIEKGPVLIAMGFGFVMMGHAILLFLLPMVLAQGGGAGKMGIFAIAILGPAQIAGRLAWKAYAARYSPKLCSLVLFVVFCVPPVLLLLSGQSTGMVYVALIVQGAGYGVHTIMRPILAQLYLPTEHLGRGLGGIATIGIVMMALGPALGGLVWSKTGFVGLMSGVFALNVFALCLIFVLFQLKPNGGVS